jgi:mRNA-degrading endonuclease toxin of MazEF toxin-antitoxin module
VVISNPAIFDARLRVLVVVPLTGAIQLAAPIVSIPIEPAPANRLSKRSFALAWNIQSIPLQRVTPTEARISREQLAEIKAAIAECLDL